MNVAFKQNALILKAALFLIMFTMVQYSCAQNNQQELVIQAQKHVEAKEYTQAITLLEMSLTEMKFDDIDTITQANQILGLSHCELNQKDKSEKYFKAALTYQPQVSIEKLLPSKPCKKYFQTLKKQNTKKNKGSSMKQFEYDPKKDIKRYLPYGVGHFKRGNKNKGKFFAITESILTATVISSAVLFANEETIGGKHVNPNRAKAYQTTFWSSLGLTLGVVTFDLVSLRKNNKNKD